MRSFQDASGDGRGDLRGLISQLDYLNDGDPGTHSDLGVDAIWLMPIHPSPSYHGYDVIDYAAVNPQYGTSADFDELCREAHRRGIKVIIDWVMNHTSDQHGWFVDAGSPTGAHHDWYVWSRSDLDWTQPWSQSRVWHSYSQEFFYGIFGADMPDLNYHNPEVRAELKRLAASWLRRGVDGFRLDASRYLVETGPKEAGEADTPETHAYWKEFSKAVHAVAPAAVLVGENTTSTQEIARYYGSTSPGGGDELNMSFNFPLADSIVRGVKKGCDEKIAETLEAVRQYYPADAIDAPFLTNHDQMRLATQLDRDPGKLRLAAAILLTLPGAPFVYYGEELGLENGGTEGDDRLKRTPFPWSAAKYGGFSSNAPWQALSPGVGATNVATETSDPASLLSWYREWIRLRKSSDALRLGRLGSVQRSQRACSPVLAFTRESTTQQALVVHNLGTTAQDLTFSDGVGSQWACLRCADGATLHQEAVQLKIHAPAGSSSVWLAPTVSP